MASMPAQLPQSVPYMHAHTHIAVTNTVSMQGASHLSVSVRLINSNKQVVRQSGQIKGKNRVGNQGLIKQGACLC